MIYRDSDEFKLLVAKTQDLFKKPSGDMLSTAFLNPTEQYFLSEYLRHEKLYDRAVFFGGAEGTERRKLFIVPDYICDMQNGEELFSTCKTYLGDEAFSDICPLLLQGSGYATFTHRDYLGSLLSLGIDRSVIGDICPIDEFSAYIFASSKIVSFLIENEVRISHDLVKISMATLPDDFVVTRKYKEISDTIASARLDCVVGALCSLSREGAKQKISAGEVERCYEVATSGAIELSSGDIISIRGTGKFVITQISELTKKGRIRLLARKYI